MIGVSKGTVTERLLSTTGNTFTSETANLTLGRVRGKGIRRSRICKEEGIPLGQQGKEHLRDVNRIRPQHKVERGKQHVVKISDA